MEQLLEMLAKSRRMGFCGGVAFLAMMAPPYWNEWLAGELQWEHEMSGIIALAAVTRGLLWAAGKAANVRIPFNKPKEG